MIQKPDFHDLSPGQVLEAVEQALGKACSNICRPLNSYINRVYEVVLDNEEAVIAKFYRPGRWSIEALEEEHQFMKECVEQEIAVVAPFEGAGGDTLLEFNGMHYCVYPKMGGRICDEPNPEQWKQLGRLIGRMHATGHQEASQHRVTLDVNHVQEQVEFIEKSKLLEGASLDGYADVCDELLDLIEEAFEQVELQKIHGDLHHQNIIYRPDEQFYLIDFDDMAMGPTVQDLWMLLPGRVTDCQTELNDFLEGYRLFHTFRESDLLLIEPLRAARMIHYTAWCARQIKDGGFTRLIPDWGSERYWSEHIRDLQIQQQEILDATPFRGFS